jgi:hypothetical protein
MGTLGVIIIGFIGLKTGATCATGGFTTTAARDATGITGATGGFAITIEDATGATGGLGGKIGVTGDTSIFTI